MAKQRVILLCIGLTAVAFAVGHYSGRLSSSITPTTYPEFVRALESRDWALRAHVVSGFVVGLGPENLTPALAAIEAHRRWLSQDELRLFMAAWARFDPEAAFARSLTWPDHTRSKGAAAAIYGWALYDPLGAREAAMEVTDSSLKALLLDRIVAAWAHGEDREGVTRYIAGLPDSPSRDRLTAILIREILSDGHLAVIEWAEALPSAHGEDFAPIAFRRAAGILAQDDHVIAKEFAEKNLDAPWGEGAPAAVARRWVHSDPAAALDWARSLPEGSARDQAINTAFVQWEKNYPAAAEHWLEQAGQSPELDSPRFALLRRRAMTSPPEALVLADLISDRAMKERGQVLALGQWFKSDREAAMHWLNTNAVSTEVRAQLRSGRKSRSKKPAEG